MTIALHNRAELHVSVSQVKTYLICPRKYELRYVRGLQPESRALALVFGSAIHEALAAFYVALQTDTEPAPEHIITVFGDALDAECREGPEVDEGKTTVGEIKDKGIALLRLFHEQVERPDKVLAVEQPFTMDLTDPRSGQVIEEQFTGVIDAIIEMHGQRVLVEHKTAARKWSQDQLEHDLQISAYLAANPAHCIRLQCLLRCPMTVLTT